MPKPLTAQQTDRVIEMAWEDRTPFEVILAQFGLAESDVIRLLRRELTPASWRRWRARATKHQAKSAVDDARFKLNLQLSITHNKISKRG